MMFVAALLLATPVSGCASWCTATTKKGDLHVEAHCVHKECSDCAPCANLAACEDPARDAASRRGRG